MTALEHLSEKPWSDYTKADYSIQQWHSACLIHLHQGAPTSKDQCKLPIKTPSGVVNKNGVFAAAAALAGARTPLQAPSDQKAKAAATLKRYYSQMGATPPPSLAKHSSIEEFIEHHGVKGMKWGVRKERNRVTTGRSSRTQPHDYRTTVPLRGRHPSTLTNRQLQVINKRQKLEQEYSRMNPNTIKKGMLYAGSVMGTATTAINLYNMYNSPAGKAARMTGANYLLKRKLAKTAARSVATGQLSFPGM